MRRMPAEQRLELLLSRGYFPKELPPTFSTESFGKNIFEILNYWERNNIFSTVNIKKKFGNYRYRLPHSEAEEISIPKKGFERRILHITHPIPQALLFQEIDQNFSRIQKKISNIKYSIDRIERSEKYKRGIKEINHIAHKTKQKYLESTNNWSVKTDISRFYPNIYTHSITWALYGKETVKRDLNQYDGTLGD